MGTFLRGCPMCIATISIAIMSLASLHAQGTSALPHVKKQGTATQLIVHDKPFLMLGGRVGEFKRIRREVHGPHLAEAEGDAPEHGSDAGLLGAHRTAGRNI